MEYYSAIKKERNNAICSNMQHAEIIILSDVSQKEKDKYHIVSLICGILNMTQMNLPMKQKQTHGHMEQTCGCQGGVGWGRDGVGGWGQQR